MTYLDDSAQARAAARRLHGLLVEVRAAPKDARNYMLFDRRDELKGFGIDDNQIASLVRNSCGEPIGRRDDQLHLRYASRPVHSPGQSSVRSLPANGARPSAFRSQVIG